jgi:tetratricopeptide (TPR) repeat protein
MISPPGILTRVRAAAILVLIAVPACAPAGSGAGASPGEIAALERRLARNPADVRVLVGLGRAYREADRADDAYRVFRRAHDQDPRLPAPAFHLGVLAESQGDVTAARAWYGRYLYLAPSGRSARQVRDRMLALERAALLADVRASLAQEAALGQVPDAATVAVYPFLYVGDDPALQPLERALAEMLSMDLAMSPELRVLERSRVQLLLDELQLAESGRVDPATAPRAGRLLQAGTIVQGRLDGTEAELSLQAAVVAAREPGRAPATLAERDAVRRLMEMQKRVAMGVFRELGVSLSPEEEARLQARQTDSLPALLLFGRGLEALDAGRFADATQLFQQAVAVDPGFGAAREHATRASSAAAGDRLTTGQLARAADSELRGLLPGDADLDAVQLLVPGGDDRSPLPDALGTEGFGRRPGIEIIIRRPGQE